MKKSTICTLVGVAAVITAVAGFGAAIGGVGDMELARGKFIVEAGAVDPDFGIETDGVILVRKVEMYQYKEDPSIDYYDTGFYEEHMPSFTIKKRDRDVTYSNPEFPEDMKTKVFCGKVLLGDSGLYVADEMLEKFNLESYVDFKNEHTLERVTDLPVDRGNSYGLTLYDGYYANGSESWEIGDLKVTFYVLMPEDDMVYTVAGDVHDGVIGEGREDNKAFIYDYENDFTSEDIAKKFGRQNLYVGIGGAAVAVLCFILSGRLKKEERKEAEIRRQYESQNARR